MGKVLRALRAGLSATARSLGPGAYEAGGTRVLCPHCRGGTFRHRVVVYLYGRATSALTCTRCGLAQMFESTPKRLEDAS